MMVKVYGVSSGSSGGGDGGGGVDNGRRGWNYILELRGAKWFVGSRIGHVQAKERNGKR